ncbi:hypothetical protein THRCLA_10894, partial [Thraustotheca clavata]
KPFGLRHFLHNIKRKDSLPVGLIDLDYILFKPLHINTGTKWGKYYQSTTLRHNDDITDTVENGITLAQNMNALLGGRWFNDWNSTMKELICGGMPCMKVQSSDAFKYYEPTGTPYIMTRIDRFRVVEDFANLTVKGRLYQKDWMVEMYAYGAGVANQNVKHTLLKHLGPAPCSRQNTEYWDFVLENSADPCENPGTLALPDDPSVGVCIMALVIEFMKDTGIQSIDYPATWFTVKL